MKLYQVDAFTSEKFRGNPAGVMLVEDFPSREYMQNIASEMNLSETVFVKNIGASEYEVQFYTPSEQIDLCGHATLSSAHILFSEGFEDQNVEIHFRAKGGDLQISKQGSLYSMSFPFWESWGIDDISAGEDITEIEGIQEVHNSDKKWKICLLKDKEAVINAAPNFQKMTGTDFGNVVVTSPGDGEYDYFMRCFVTDCGINEDPVTGSIECVLAPFWSEKFGRTKMKSYQCSARGGEKGVELRDKRVIISGEAVTVFEIEVL